MFHKNPDLVAVSIAAIIGALLGVSGLHFGAWLSIFGILLVLVLPGYVLSQLLLPNLPLDERLLVSLGLSLVIDGLSGLLLHLTPWGLRGSTWGMWLAMITLVGVVFLWKRREPGEEVRTFTFTWPKITWLSVLPYALALGFALITFGIAQLNIAYLNAPLTMLWANKNPTNREILNIGIRNEEGETMIYNLVVQQNGVKVREWSAVKLNEGKTFTGQFDFQLPPQEPVNVLLYRADAPDQIYRQVRIYFSGNLEKARSR